MIHEFIKIKTPDKTEINCLIKEVGSQNWLIATHGVGEHLGRHDYLIKNFSQYYNICLYDLRGHGDSSGKSAYVEDFQDYYSDLDSILTHLKSTFALKNYQLFGHSMGALITAGFVQNRLHNKEQPSKVFLSAPPVAVAGIQGKIFQYSPLVLSKTLANLPISIPLKGLVDLKNLSHDVRVYQNYINDEKNKLALHSRLLLQMVAESRNVFSRPLRVKGELYVAYGSEDRIVNLHAIAEYFTNIEKNSSLCRVEGGFHELHNEIEKYRSVYFDFLKKSLLGH